jgi:hypothetical protein
LGEQTVPLATACEMLSIPLRLAHNRLARGWTIQEALEPPIKRGRKSKKEFQAVSPENDALIGNGRDTNNSDIAL